MVQQRAPRQRLQVAPGDHGVRGPAGRWAEFVGARDGTVVLVRNTTEAIDVLAGRAARGQPRALDRRRASRQHAAVAAPRPHRAAGPGQRDGELVERCEHALRVAQPRIDLVAVTGASNVTGEVWPLAELAAVAHHYGAELFVDAAQLAPHRAIDMAATGIDYLALSGHKLYAPFGAGALVACGRALERGEPLLHGGGAIELVTLDDVVWADAPERYEAGSPNVVGAVALGAARRNPRSGRDAARRGARARALRAPGGGARGVPGLRPLALWSDPTVDRVGVVTFELEGYRHPLLAAILSAEHAIGVRHGCFCAHPLLAHLLGVPADDLEHPARGAPFRRASCAAGGRAGELRARDHRAGRRPPGRRPGRDRPQRAALGLVRDGAHDEYRPAPDVRALPRTPSYEPAAASASARPLRS